MNSVSVIGGIFSGVVLGLANFYALKKIVARMTADTVGGNSKGVLFFLAKLFVLFGAVAFVVLVLKVHPLGLMAGFALVIAGVVLWKLFL